MGDIDTSVPVSARIWNYWMGGTDHYQVDAEAGQQFAELYPGITDMARASRLFLVRTVTYLATEAGIRQFLDIGPGLPSGENTHQVAQRAAAGARVVYVDNDHRLSGSVHAVGRSTRQREQLWQITGSSGSARAARTPGRKSATSSGRPRAR
jgi:hypothetical protein